MRRQLRVHLGVSLLYLAFALDDFQPSEAVMLHSANSRPAKSLRQGLFAGTIRPATAYVLLLAAGLFSLERFDLLPNGPDHWSADWRTVLFSPRPHTQHERIAIVEVTDSTLANYPYRNPIDRSLIARLIEVADAAGAKAIGLDFAFVRPTEPDKDAALLAAIRKAHAHVIVGGIDTQAPLTKEQLQFHNEFLQKAARTVGHLYFDERRDALTISDHVVRFMATEHRKVPWGKSFAQALADVDGPYAPQLSRYINWLLPPRDGSEPFLNVSADSLLEPIPQSEAVRASLHGKLVLIGGNLFDTDQHLTPLAVVDGTRLPGIMIHAHILAQLIDGRSIRALDWPVHLALLIGISTLGFILGRRYQLKRYDFVVGIVGTAALLCFSIVAFWRFQFVLPFTSPLLAWLGGVTGGHYSDSVVQRYGLSGKGGQ